MLVEPLLLTDEEKQKLVVLGKSYGLTFDTVDLSNLANLNKKLNLRLGLSASPKGSMIAKFIIGSNDKIKAIFDLS